MAKVRKVLLPWFLMHRTPCHDLSKQYQITGGQSELSQLCDGRLHCWILSRVRMVTDVLGVAMPVGTVCQILTPACANWRRKLSTACTGRQHLYFRSGARAGMHV